MDQQFRVQMNGRSRRTLYLSVGAFSIDSDAREFSQDRVCHTYCMKIYGNDMNLLLRVENSRCRSAMYCVFVGRKCRLTTSGSGSVPFRRFDLVESLQFSQLPIAFAFVTFFFFVLPSLTVKQTVSSDALHKFENWLLLTARCGV